MAKKGNGIRKYAQKACNDRLTPQQIAVVVGLLTNALEVDSILIDRNQRIEIVLEGSFRRKTKVDQIAEDLDDVSVTELINAFIRKY
ncbi:hypothetical protein [Paenibacillus koleovorans]|uniref:hypothetical protein n=1 Tax=Paenibacillus koleovorans TaxID=121608 RepID=UPI00157FFEF4|nr:hypothetical protein [Paenibacillus koleovorans]